MEGLICPWCGEPADIFVDTLLDGEGGGEHQRYVEDCAVCCRPCVVNVAPAEQEGGEPVVTIDRE